MRVYRIYNIEFGKKELIKQFIDITRPTPFVSGHCPNGYSDKSSFIKSELHTIILIFNKTHSYLDIWREHFGFSLMESYNRTEYSEFENIEEIKPSFKNRNKMRVDYFTGFVYPEKYRDKIIYQFDYFHDMDKKQPYKFVTGRDELFYSHPHNYTYEVSNTLLN